MALTFQVSRHFARVMTLKEALIRDYLVLRNPTRERTLRSKKVNSIERRMMKSLVFQVTVRMRVFKSRRVSFKRRPNKFKPPIIYSYKKRIRSIE